MAAFVCPGHPLLDAVLDLTMERNRDLLRRGCCLVDESDDGEEPRVVFFLEHAIQDAGGSDGSKARTVSQRVLYVEMDAMGGARGVQYAPYLDFRPLKAEEPQLEAILSRPECSWITRELADRARAHAIANVVPAHLDEVRSSRLRRIAKVRVAVKERLSKEIVYWDHRAADLADQEAAGRPNARLNSQEARKRADNLQARLEKRMEELDRESQISALPPVALGGFVVVPVGLLRKMAGQEREPTTATADKQAAARRARQIVMEVERSLGFEPVDREEEKLGYDIESRVPGEGTLRFIEVKGRVSGAATLTVTRNEILYSLNKPETYILAVVEFLDGGEHRVHYLREPFRREPDFAATSVNYDFADLLARARPPA